MRSPSQSVWQQVRSIVSVGIMKTQSWTCLSALVASGLLCSIVTMQAQSDASENRFPPTGGMWLPGQIPELEGVLRELGLEIDPQALADPTSNVLNAIVSLDGCSGSFVSENGLIITNHHCVESYLSFMTEEDKAALQAINEERAKEGLPPIEADIDYMRDGYDYRNGGERFTGPESRVFITFEQKDITERMTKGLADIDDPLKRYEELERREKEVLEEAETDPSIRAEVRSFFRGEQFLLIRKRKLKDLRMVYAPPKAVGYFGGDARNWEFPRHVGDFALLRVYTGPNGESADFAQENLPYKPENTIPIPEGGGDLAPGDLVFVAGYPGRTERATTLAESKDTVDRVMPFTIQALADLRAVFKELESRNETLASKTQPSLFGIENYLKNQREATRILEEIGYLQKKADLQEALLAWMKEDPARHEKYAPALEEMDAIQERYQEGWKKRAYTRWLFHGFFNPVFNAALTLVRTAKEKEKPDAERLPAFQEREYENLRDSLKQMQATYAREIALEVSTHVLTKLLEAEGENPEFVTALPGSDLAKNPDETAIRSKFRSILENTALEDPETRLNLFQNASYEELKQSDDPLVQLAVAAEKDVLAYEEHGKAMGGEMLLAAPLYVEALRAFLEERDQTMAPDANSTLRITFGQVGGYEKQVGARTKRVPTFTTFRQLIEEEHQPGKKDFEVPPRWLAAFARAREYGYGPYAERYFGDLPVNFLANVDTTGGNSGSAALNAKGELAGLLFDGNTDSLYGDYVFDRHVRSILLDIRYALWILDEIEGLDEILEEMGVRPSCGERLVPPEAIE